MIFKIYSQLCKKQIYESLNKCQFFRETLTFLGFQVSSKGVSPDPNKLKTLQHLKAPTDVSEIRSLLGFFNFFRHLIPNFSIIANPLNILLKKNATFIWKMEQQHALDTLKQELLQAPLLQFPNYQKPFIISTDASNVGIAGVIAELDADGKEKPLAFASRTLTKAEKNYSITDKEALAVYWILSKFRTMIYGYDVHVYTDHQPLLPLFKSRELEGRKARWNLKIQAFNPTFHYKKGKLNIAPDYLSRYIPDATTYSVNTVSLSSHIYTLNRETIVEHQQKCKRLSPLIKWVESHKTSHCAPHIMINKILYYVTNTAKHLIQVPDSLIYSVIDTSHSTLGAGHPGPERTEQRIKEIYTFPKMSQLIIKYCKTCKSCLSVKGAPPKSAPISNYPFLPFIPFSRVHFDILGVLPTCTSTSNKYILVFKDYLTRYVEITPLPNRETKTIANALLHCIIKPHSTPDVLISDNAAEFTSSLLKELCEMWNIKKAEIVARHPSSNSICERENAKIENYLRHFVSSNQHDWDQYLPFAQIALNTTYNTSIGTDPHFLLHSYHKRLPYQPHDYVSPFLYNKQENRKDFVHDYVGEMYTRSMAIRDQARQRLQYKTNKFTDYQHQNALERKIEIGDSVYILDIKRPFQSPKLAKRWIGPYTVANIINERKYLLLCKVTGKTFVCHKDNFKLALCEVTSTQKLQDYPVLECQKQEMKRQQNIIPHSNDSAYFMPPSTQHDRQRSEIEQQQ